MRTMSRPVADAWTIGQSVQQSSDLRSEWSVSSHQTNQSETKDALHSRWDHVWAMLFRSTEDNIFGECTPLIRPNKTHTHTHRTLCFTYTNTSTLHFKQNIMQAYQHPHAHPHTNTSNSRYTHARIAVVALRRAAMHALTPHARMAAVALRRVARHSTRTVYVALRRVTVHARTCHALIWWLWCCAAPPCTHIRITRAC